MLRPFVYMIVFVTLASTADNSAAQTTLQRRKVAETEANTHPTKLDEYVAEPDDTYSWKQLAKTTSNGMTAYVIDMKSQRWLTEKEVDRPVWQHWITIVKPANATSKTALMFIGGGSNDRQPPEGPDAQLMQLAMATNSVVASVSMIPNQPLTFHNDGQPRKEDDLIGYTWDQYLKTGDDIWPARLPMTKAVVRAMDTVQEVSSKADWNGPKVEDFVVAGGSKRGWTTWTVGVVDPRVKAIAPIVIDVLNANVSMDHHYSAYGFWAPAIGDYVAHQVTHRRFWPRYKDLLQLVDPFAYRDRLTLPKCLINATGDQFFLPDSSQFYFDELKGEKHLCYVPNGDHSLNGTNALETLISFHHCIMHDVARPEYSWTFPAEDTIAVTPKTKPEKVLLWQASNPDARDFRVDTIGRGYKPTELKPQSDGRYVGTVDVPEEGFRAYLIQLEFNVGAATPMRLSTPVRVVPDTLPFGDIEAPTIDQ